MKAVFDRLFAAIEHGDAEHRAWLRAKLDDFVAREEATDDKIMAIARRTKPCSDGATLLAWFLLEQAEARHQRAVNKSLQEEIDMLYGKQP